MRLQLDFVSACSAKMNRRYQEQVRELKQKLRTPNRVINQALQRKMNTIQKKNSKIQELKKELCSSSGNTGSNNKLAAELASTKAELSRLKRAHQKLKAYNRKRNTVPVGQHLLLKKKLKEKNEVLKTLENDNVILQEKVEELSSTGPTGTLKTGKTYSANTRMTVFDCIINKVPTDNIPTLIKQTLRRLSASDTSAVPQRTTVELMARELGAISELQTAETILDNPNCTIGFDATTQEGTHINEIHFTTVSQCVCAAIDELPGGTAEDYANHICQTVDRLAETYCHFNRDNEEECDYQDIRQKLINNISNSMSDRCAANHAALQTVNSVWNKTLNEMNCHLHPLDSIATGCRTSLKKVEESWKVKGKVFGRDCMAANLILAINKLRYKDGKGDPRGFVTFLDDKKIPRGILPRYRGNRLHVLFHIAGVLVEHRKMFAELFKTGTSIGGLRSSIMIDFADETSLLELQVLGLLGKKLTGPWMTKFYTSASPENELDHVEGIRVVRVVIENARRLLQEPMQLLSTSHDLFGDELNLDDTTLQSLINLTPHNKFPEAVSACVQSVIDVLERQYKRYFTIEVTEQLKEETASTRMHNIDSEEVMGMFGAAQARAPNATLCFLSSRMRACKNRTVDYLDNLTEMKREMVLKKAVKLGRRQRDNRRRTQKELKEELIKRQKQKQQSRDDAQRRKMEKLLKDNGLEALRSA